MNLIEKLRNKAYSGQSESWLESGKTLGKDKRNTVDIAIYYQIRIRNLRDYLRDEIWI